LLLVQIDGRVGHATIPFSPVVPARECGTNRTAIASKYGQTRHQRLLHDRNTFQPPLSNQMFSNQMRCAAVRHRALLQTRPPAISSALCLAIRITGPTPTTFTPTITPTAQTNAAWGSPRCSPAASC